MGKDWLNGAQHVGEDFVVRAPDGRIERIGRSSVVYGDNGRPLRVGENYVYYDALGRIGRIGTAAVIYRPDGVPLSIGGRRIW